MTEKIRTLGFYQPFGSLMLHNKIETRWIKEGKKPPFPLGKYLFYTTKKCADTETLLNWCGKEIMDCIREILAEENTMLLENGYALAIGDLIKVEPLKKEEESKSFVKFIGTKTERVAQKNDSLIHVTKKQWGLHFENIQRIEPFMWKFGKQGIGFVPESEYQKIKTI